MPEYIQVSRRFDTYNPTVSGEADDFTFLYSGDHSAAFTWPDLIKLKACVVIAEGQSGKSEEFRQQAASLQAEGKFAFYCPLESLLHFKLQDALDAKSSAALACWATSDVPAWFFLDAVDEAKIESPRHFELAIANAVSSIAPSLSRAHIIVSSRPHAWDAVLDHRMLCRRLGLRELEEERQDADADDITEEETSLETAKDPQSIGSNGKSSQVLTQALKVFQLAPLTRAQAQDFARAQGLLDADAFIAAIEHANADVFANRPDDLLGLIYLWKTTQKIEGYTKVVESNVKRKLDEHNPLHEHAATLTPERARAGVEQLAAAVTLTRKPAIIVPLQSISSDLSEQCVDPRVVLPDWTSSEIAELLGRPLFDQSFYGTVRFHHRTAREFLTAGWLRRLLEKGKHRRSVHDLLFAKPYGTEKLVVRPSLKPIAGWLAQWDQEIRGAVLKIDPKILLEFGDASALPVDIRATLLAQYAERYADRSRTSLNLHVREIQRLADAQLAPTIRTLLIKHRGNVGLRQLLLRIVREGKISDCYELVATFAYDQEMDAYTRGCAIEAVAAAGSPDDQRRMCQKFITDATPIARSLVAALVDSFFPSVLSVADLLLLLRKATEPEEHTISGLRYRLSKAAGRLHTAETLRDCLTGLESILSQRPHVDRFCPVSRRYFWLLEFSMIVLRRLTELDRNSQRSSAAYSILLMATHADHIREYTGSTKTWALEMVEKDHAMRHGMFWFDVERARSIEPQTPVLKWSDRRLIFHSFDQDNVADYLADLSRRPSLDDQLLALSVLVVLSRHSENPEPVVEAIRKAISGIPALESSLADQTKPIEPTLEDTRHKREMDRLDRQIEKRQIRRNQYRQKGIVWLKENASTLVVGDHAKDGRLLKNIEYLYREIVSQMEGQSRWSVANWRALEVDYGSAVAIAFRDYCIGYWRLFEPKLRSDPTLERNSTPMSVAIGLTGVAMEASQNKNWAEGLSSDDAVRAARYALWEMNGFPTWFNALVTAKKDDVSRVFRMEIEWEFQQDDGAHVEYFVMSRLQSDAPDLREKLRSDVIDLLVERDIRCRPALVAALSGVLSSSAPLPSEFRKAVNDRASADASDPLRAAWLAALLCIDGAVGLSRVATWVTSADDRKLADKRVVLLLNYIWGERSESFHSEHRAYLDADILLALTKLAHTQTTLGDESLRHREGWVGDRDRATKALNTVMALLSDQPGRRSHQALLDLAASGISTLPRDYMLILAERRAEADADLTVWIAKDIPSFAKDAEFAPRTPQDLFAIVVSRLDDIKLELEEGDESVASTLQRAQKEPELRKYFAGRLRQTSGGKYDVGSEEELANIQRTDIRLHNAAVSGSNRVPIEIKIAENWSAQKLLLQLNEQLVGDYMRESTCGIFLLLRRGNMELEDKNSWKKSRAAEPMDFVALVDWLSKEAQALQVTQQGISLRVVGIDLTRRGS